MYLLEVCDCEVEPFLLLGMVASGSQLKQMVGTVFYFHQREMSFRQHTDLRQLLLLCHRSAMASGLAQLASLSKMLWLLALEAASLDPSLCTPRSSEWDKNVAFGPPGKRERKWKTVNFPPAPRNPAPLHDERCVHHSELQTCRPI